MLIGLKRQADRQSWLLYIFYTKKRSVALRIGRTRCLRVGRNLHAVRPSDAERIVVFAFPLLFQKYRLALAPRVLRPVIRLELNLMSDPRVFVACSSS